MAPIPLHRPGLKLHRACSGRPRSQDEGRPSQPTPQPKTTVEGAEREKREAEDNREGQAEEAENKGQEAASKMLAWMARIVPGCLIHCVEVAENEYAIDSSARVLDHMIVIVTHLQARYRMFWLLRRCSPTSTSPSLPSQKWNLRGGSRTEI